MGLTRREAMARQDALKRPGRSVATRPMLTIGFIGAPAKFPPLPSGGPLPPVLQDLRRGAPAPASQPTIGSLAPGASDRIGVGPSQSHLERHRPVFQIPQKHHRVPARLELYHVARRTLKACGVSSIGTGNDESCRSISLGKSGTDQVIDTNPASGWRRRRIPGSGCTAGEQHDQGAQ